VRVKSEKLRSKKIGGKEHVPTLVVYDMKVDKKLSLNVVVDGLVSYERDEMVEMGCRDNGESG